MYTSYEIACTISLDRPGVLLSVLFARRISLDPCFGNFSVHRSSS